MNSIDVKFGPVQIHTSTIACKCKGLLILGRFKFGFVENNKGLVWNFCFWAVVVSHKQHIFVAKHRQILVSLDIALVLKGPPALSCLLYTS